MADEAKGAVAADVEPEEATVNDEGVEQDDDGAIDDKDLAGRDTITPQERVELRRAYEAVMFVADKPVTVRQLRDLRRRKLSGPLIRSILDEIGAHLEGRGFVMASVAGGYQLRSSPDAGEDVQRFLAVRPRRLSRPALETLAVVAYRQPMTRGDMEEIRGVDCGAVVKSLLERRLIRILGKKEEPGRPLLYGTTKEFLEFFNLRDLQALPTLREFHELSEDERARVDKLAEEAEEAQAEAAAEAKKAGGKKVAGKKGRSKKANGKKDAALADADADSALEESGDATLEEDGS